MVKQFIKERLGTIVLFAVIIIFVIWGSLNIKEARQNAIVYSSDYVAPEGNVDFEKAGSFESIAKTDKLELFYNEAKGAIQVKNLENGYLWKGIADNEVINLDDLNAQWAAYLQSPITISYNDLKKRDSGVKKLYAAKDSKWMESEYIENGVSVTYGFTAPGIYVTIEYVLEDDQLVVRLPADGIREESQFALTTVELLPFLGAAGNDQEGYLFYPDGSGAITTYENVNKRPSNVKAATYFTYTNKSVDFEGLWNDDKYDRYTAAMPVYGIKNGDNALFATFTEGAENTGVVVFPSGYVVDLNHAGFEIYTRNVFNVNMYSMSTGAETSATGGMVQRVDNKVIEEDREAHYFFLSGEDADYSGMAVTYRDYLTENGLLAQSDAENGEMALALDLLMGVTKDGMVFDEYIAMTDFEQVQEILTRLNEAGVANTQVVLEAWMSGYYDYEFWGPARQLGGKSGLKDLSKFNGQNQKNNIYLANDLVFATSKTKDIEEKTDVAKDGLDVEMAVDDWDGMTYYLLNPQAVYNRNAKFLSKLEKYDALGLAYESIGQYAYADYNMEAPFTKGETVEKLRELLASTKEADRNIAIRGANQYSYTSADYIYRLKEESFGLSITDHAVPFVQMVLSGMIPYATDGAGNLSYDLQEQKLKWVEYGALPYFHLTYESALKLRDTGWEDIFSSTYTDWEDTVVETYKEFEQKLACVRGVQITDHKILSEDLVRVEYANAVCVYINYGGQDVTADGISIPAKEYVVVGGGE